MQFLGGEYVIWCDILKKTCASERERGTENGEEERQVVFLNQRDRQRMMGRKTEGVERASDRTQQ